MATRCVNSSWRSLSVASYKSGCMSIEGAILSYFVGTVSAPAYDEHSSTQCTFAYNLAGTVFASVGIVGSIGEACPESYSAQTGRVLAPEVNVPWFVKALLEESHPRRIVDQLVLYHGVGAGGYQDVVCRVVG